MNHAKKFLAQFALSLLFIASSAVFLVFSKLRITSYMAQVQAYASQVYALKDVATTTEGLLQLQSILEAIKPIVLKATIYTYVITPAVLLILWALLIGTSFYVSLKQPKAAYRRYLMNFTVLSIIPVMAAEYFALKILQYSSDLFLAGTGLWMIIAYAAALLTVAYIAFVAYALAASAKLKEIIQRTIILCVKRIHVLLPLFLLLSVIILALLAAAMSTYLNLFSSIIGLSTAYNFAALFVILSVAIIIKNYTIKIITKRSRAL